MIIGLITLLVQLLLGAAWFFLPAGAANLTPPLVAGIPGLRGWLTPLDLGRCLGGKRLLGDHKTWRGLIFGVIAAGATSGLQHLMAPIYDSGGRALMAGLILGLGALLGDAVKSFVKRRVGVPSGQSWFPFDQIDYIVGGLLAIAWLVPLSLPLVSAVVLVYFCLHLLFGYIGFRLGLKTTRL